MVLAKGRITATTARGEEGIKERTEWNRSTTTLGEPGLPDICRGSRLGLVSRCEKEGLSTGNRSEGLAPY